MEYSESVSAVDRISSSDHLIALEPHSLHWPVTSCTRARLKHTFQMKCYFLRCLRVPVGFQEQSSVCVTCVPMIDQFAL